MHSPSRVRHIRITAAPAAAFNAAASADTRAAAGTAAAARDTAAAADPVYAAETPAAARVAAASADPIDAAVCVRCI